MKIEDRKNLDAVKFADIKDGEVLTNAIHYYLKINREMWDNEEFNAVRLDNGDLIHFYDSETVLKVNARVVIE